MRTGRSRRGTDKNSERGGRCARPNDGRRPGRLPKYRCLAPDAPEAPFSRRLWVSLLAENYGTVGSSVGAGWASTFRAVRSGVAPPLRSALQTFAFTLTRSFGASAPRLCASWRLTRVFASTMIVAEPACLYARPCLFECLTVRTTVTAGLHPEPVVGCLWPLPGSASAAETAASEATRARTRSFRRIVLTS